MSTSTDSLTGADWQRLIAATADTIADHAAELSRLDAVTGDGDHGVNVTTALAHAHTQLVHVDGSNPGAVLTMVADSFLDHMGGAAGALFGSFFAAAAESIGDRDAIDTRQFADAIAHGTAIVAKLGKADAGDKTMLDALLRAVEASRRAADRNASITETLRLTAQAARAGATATTAMRASAGRARHAGEKSIGVQDPGATTVALIFEAWAAACHKTQVDLR